MQPHFFVCCQLLCVCMCVCVCVCVFDWFFIFYYFINYISFDCVVYCENIYSKLISLVGFCCIV